MASSAAGLACFVRTLADLYNINLNHIYTLTNENNYITNNLNKLTTIARQGSGSACRSLFGGFVEWTMGHRQDAEDSIAVQIYDENVLLLFFLNFLYRIYIYNYYYYKRDDENQLTFQLFIIIK